MLGCGWVSNHNEHNTCCRTSVCVCVCVRACVCVNVSIKTDWKCNWTLGRAAFSYQELCTQYKTITKGQRRLKDLLIVAVVTHTHTHTHLSISASVCVCVLPDNVAELRF